MRYELDLIHELCQEIGLPSRIAAQQCVEVDVGDGAVLCFRNAGKDDDCLIGFLGTPWHTHDNLMFADARGHYVELNYLDLVTALKEGRVLVSERHVDGRLIDRWLIHSEFNDEFRYLQEGEQIVVRRATSRPASVTRQ